MMDRSSLPSRGEIVLSIDRGVGLPVIAVECAGWNVTVDGRPVSRCTDTDVA